MKITTQACLAVAGVLIVLAVGQILAQDWPQWRGPDRDGKATFTAPETWPKALAKKWQVKVGAGDSSPVQVGDKVYIFARVGDDEVTRCLNGHDGKEVWRDKNPVAAIEGPAAREHAGPRATPAVAGDKVVTLGVGGMLSCLDAAKGAVVWRKDEIKSTPRFFTSSSPLIADGLVIAQLGSEDNGAIVAYDLANGKEKWKCAEGTAYASPVLATIDGVKQVVALTSKKLVGVSAADGKLLWEVPFAPQGRAYNAATPIVDGSTVIFTGQGRGTKAVKIEKKGDAFAATELWSSLVAVAFSSPVLKEGMLYGGSDKGDLFCLDAKTGKTVWTKEAKLGGYAAMLDLGSAILALPNDGQMIVFKPGKEYAELGKYKVGESGTYACPAAAGDRIFAKDKENLVLWVESGGQPASD
jgi:outer membrane protein assembly factor BamB